MSHHIDFKYIKAKFTFLKQRQNHYKWVSESHSVVSDSLQPHGLYSPWNSPGQNTGVGSLSLLQGIFPTQGWNPGLQHCGRILHQLSHKGSPRILERVACPFSSGSSQPRNGAGVSCTAGGFFTNWTIREAWSINYIPIKKQTNKQTKPQWETTIPFPERLRFRTLTISSVFKD